QAGLTEGGGFVVRWRDNDSWESSDEEEAELRRSVCDLVRERAALRDRVDANGRALHNVTGVYQEPAKSRRRNQQQQQQQQQTAVTGMPTPPLVTSKQEATTTAPGGESRGVGRACTGEGEGDGDGLGLELGLRLGFRSGKEAGSIPGGGAADSG
ncbi:unnamed protein product, partial [Discosporangium mesarthrocarpum]